MKIYKNSKIMSIAEAKELMNEAHVFFKCTPECPICHNYVWCGIVGHYIEHKYGKDGKEKTREYHNRRFLNKKFS